jgi:hypothetical protein
MRPILRGLSVSQDILDSPRAALIPGVAAVLLVFFYATFQTFFLSCPPKVKLVTCEGITSTQLFPSYELGSVGLSAEMPDEKRAKAETDRGILANRYSGRLLWMFVAAVGVITGVVAMAIAAILLYRSLRNLVASAVLLGLAIASGTVLFLKPGWHMSIMKDVLIATIANGTAGMASIASVMNLFNVINYVGGLALIFATCSILLPRGKSNSKDLDDISGQMNDLRLVLYIGTLQLVVGVLRMGAVTQWTLSFIVPGAVIAAKSFNAVLVAVMGGFYTLILIAIYVPAVLILTARARKRVGKLSLDPDVRQKKLEEAGLAISVKDALPRVFALLAPLLAGPIGQIFSALAS